MWRSSAHVAIAICLLGLFLVRESREPHLARVDAGFVDWLAGNAQRDVAPAPLVLAEINDNSLATAPWPWSPFDYALFFQAVLPLEPAVIACEPILAWDDAGRERQYDRMLSELIRRAPKVLLGARLGQREDPDVLELQRTPLLPHVVGDTSSLPQYSLVEKEPAQQFSLSSRIGFVNLNPSQRNVRRVPLIFLYRGQAVPSFALQAMMMWLQLTPDDVRIEVGSHIDLGDKMQVPIDDSGMVLIDFEAPIVRFGVDDLLLAAEQTAAGLPPTIPVERLAGNIILLARTDSEVATLRLPDGSLGTAGEVVAATIATIQQQTFIRRVVWWFDYAIIAAAMLVGVVFIRFRPMGVIMGSIVVFVGYLLACLSVFALQLVWLPLVLPTCLIVFLMLYALVLPAPRTVKADVPSDSGKSH